MVDLSAYQGSYPAPSKFQGLVFQMRVTLPLPAVSWVWTSMDFAKDAARPQRQVEAENRMACTSASIIPESS
jgi:hypothetical protein